MKNRAGHVWHLRQPAGLTLGFMPSGSLIVSFNGPVAGLSPEDARMLREIGPSCGQNGQNIVRGAHLATHQGRTLWCSSVHLALDARRGTTQ